MEISRFCGYIKSNTVHSTHKKFQILFINRIAIALLHFKNLPISVNYQNEFANGTLIGNIPNYDVLFSTLQLHYFVVAFKILVDII